MELFRNLVEDKQALKIVIRHVPSTLQKKATKNSKKLEREPAMSGNEHRRSEDPSCHYMGCSYPLLYDQHWQTSRVFDLSRTANEMAVSSSKPVGGVDIDLRANCPGCQVPTNQGPIPSVNNKCGVDIKASEDHKDLVRSVANRIQECQKTINNDATGSRFVEPLSISSRRGWEFEKESRALEIRELCGNEHMVASSIMETRATNQNSCNKDSNTNDETTLRQLPPDHATQLDALLDLLKNKDHFSFHDATNNDILYDDEINIFAGIYGITDFRLVLASGHSVFLLEDPGGGVYFWSRIDDSMIRGGDNMKEALTNYLFHQENLCYVDENTRELVPVNEYDHEALEWVKSPESCICIDADKLLRELPPNHGSKSGKKKKQKKKKNKNKH